MAQLKEPLKQDRGKERAESMARPGHMPLLGSVVECFGASWIGHFKPKRVRFW